jgi:hypothetical protein
MGESGALDFYKRLPVPEYAESTLLDHFHKFTLLGGMPEIIEEYAQHRDMQVLGSIYRSLQESYKNDVDKYASNSTMVQTLRIAIDSLPLEAGQRIKFEGFGKTNYSSRQMGEALRTLEKALLLNLLYPTTQTDFPLMPNKRKSPRLQILDTGLLNFFGGLQTQLLMIKDLNAIHGGKVIEHMVGQEILASSFNIDHKLKWWAREEKHSMAEVDFILPIDGKIIPVEVKAGATGSLKSLLLMMDLLPHPYAIRLYSGKMGIDEIKTNKDKKVYLLNLPYFLAGRLEDYAKWLMVTKPN